MLFSPRRWTRHGPTDLSQLFTLRMTLSATDEAYELFTGRCDGVVKIAMVPDPADAP